MEKELLIASPANLAQWLRIYRLYMRAFPKCERKPLRIIWQMYKKGKTDIWYCSCGGSFAGLGITINGPDTVLLDYFAVEISRRGEGIGSALLPKFMDMYAPKSFFLEIESTYVPAENGSERINRKRFYLRNGLEEMGTEAYLFGVRMELLGKGCVLGFDEYRNFYRDNYNQWAADNIKPI